MSIIDKITGRTKKAAGDVSGDSSLRAQGRREERKGEEKDKLADAQERADERPRMWPISSAAPSRVVSNHFAVRTGALEAPVCLCGGVP
jgi:uncharacterized protein YjbJ (UPF0337 family)